MKYIDADRLRAEIKRQIRLEELNFAALGGGGQTFCINTLEWVIKRIDSLQQEQPDFPTTDEETEMLLATHPKVEVPNKYKTPDWLWKKQGQPEGLHFTPLYRLIQKIPSKNWNDTVNNYAKKLRDCLIKEGYRKDAEVLQGYISYMNGNNVPMATMDEQEQPELQPIGYAETYYQKGLYDGIIKGRMEILKGLEQIEKRKADPILIINGQEHPEIFDSVAFQKGVQEGRRLEREDVKSIIQSRIDEILGDAQPNPILRMELQELIKKIEL